MTPIDNPVVISQKKCSKCGIIKSNHEFYTRKGSKDGYRNECKACLSVTHHARYLSLQNEIKAKVSARYHTNPESVKQYQREYNEANKDRIRARQAAYNFAHKEVIAERKAIKHQAGKTERDAYRAAHPKIAWTETTVGHHGLTGQESREKILKMAENTMHCPICNCELKYSGKKAEWHSASLDRRNNDQSKRIEDFWIICRHCNTTKHNRNMEQMDAWCLQWQRARQEGMDRSRTKTQ